MCEIHVEMVTKLLSTTTSDFRLRLRQSAQKGFHRTASALQTFLLAFLVSLKNLMFRYERVL